ncbi:MAG: TlpA family protein disulfide reductase [Bdellovibrionales bacterium]|nr:TlpA family protein disulfide reductase [Bdellovibrionales bacterium]
MKKLRLILSLALGIFVVGGMLAYLVRQGVFKSTSGGAPAVELPLPVGAGAEEPKVRGGVKPYPARAFELQDAEGRRHRMTDLAGKIVVLHFWATWCAPCVEEIPDLLKFAKRLGDAPVVILAVSMDDTWEKAHTVLKPLDLPRNVLSLLDPRSEVPERYGSFQFPESYLIDSRLRVVAKWVGIQKWMDPYYEEEVRRLASSASTK